MLKLQVTLSSLTFLFGNCSNTETSKFYYYNLYNLVVLLL